MRFRLKVSLAAPALYAIFAAAVLADMAPTQFTASGIVPVDAPDIRMVSAKVEIEWGSPCQLSAEFVLENDTAEAVEIQLGFPMTLPESLRDKNALGFTIAFDGGAVDPKEITTDRSHRDRRFVEETWYLCRHVFRPGHTKVVVKSKLAASLSKWPFRERLNYRIETGGRWKGPIGHEEVTVRFPRPISPSMFVEAAPAGHIIDGTTIRWRFDDIEPKGAEYDIDLRYLRPDIDEALTKMRAELAANPTDSRLILKLARHLFVLGPIKGYGHWPPSLLSQAEYDSILGRLKDTSQRTLFESRYRPTDQGGYHEKSSAWTEERWAVVEMLNKIEYVPPGAQSPHVDEARNLVERLLKEQPYNAEAWNVYLANYYLFRFAGVSPIYPHGIYLQHQIDLIEEAHKQCPKDPGVTLWRKVRRHAQTNTRDETDVTKKLAELGIFRLEYPKIEYDYY